MDRRERRKRREKFMSLRAVNHSGVEGVVEKSSIEINERTIKNSADFAKNLCDLCG